MEMREEEGDRQIGSGQIGRWEDMLFEINQ